MRARSLVSSGRRTFALRARGATAASEITTSSSLRDRKRFYDTVGVERVVVGNGVERWEVNVDGRTVRTPRGMKLRVPTEMLARTIAAEWARQTEFLQPEDMPVMVRRKSSRAVRLPPLAGERSSALRAYLSIPSPAPVTHTHARKHPPSLSLSLRFSSFPSFSIHAAAVASFVRPLSALPTPR